MLKLSGISKIHQAGEVQTAALDRMSEAVGRVLAGGESPS